MAKPAAKKTSRARPIKKKPSASNEEASWVSARDEQHRLKRDAILRVASRLINRKGVTGTSLADIADELNLKNASLYYYFKSKSELVFACFQRAQRIDMESLRMAEKESTTGLDAIERYMAIMGDRIREEGPPPLPVGIRALEDEQMHEIMAARGEKMKRMASILRRGIKDESIRPCDVTLTTSILMAALQVLPDQYSNVSKTKASQLDKEVTTSIRRLLGA